MTRMVRSLVAGVALAATMATSMVVATSADARMLHIYKRPHFIPAVLKPGYVGAPGYPYGPPGPIVYFPVDIPPAGIFTIGGAVGFGTGIVTGVVTGVPAVLTPVPGGLVPGLPFFGAIK